MSCNCGCGTGQCGGLGQYPGGHSIPYTLNDSEIETFLNNHQSDSTLTDYLGSRTPPYGIIVNEAYGQYLVWFDASGKLWIVDVTNLSVASQVQAAPYESPDASIIDNIQAAIQAGLHTLAGVGVLAGVIALGYILYRVRS